jgi:hypothetical protein
MYIGRNVQDKKCGPHVKNYKEEDEHNGPAGTHDTNAYYEPEYSECRNYDGAASGHHDKDGQGAGAK